MPIQFNYDDDFKRNNPQAYLVVDTGSWKRGDGGVSVETGVYANKAAFDAGGKPVLQFSKFIPLDTGTLLAAVEHVLLTDPLVAQGAPSQVA